MITSKEVKQFLREKCESVVAGIAPATPFTDEDKKRITATLKTISEANPGRLRKRDPPFAHRLLPGRAG